MNPISAQTASRLYLTRAIVDNGNFELTPYRKLLGVDRVEIGGRVYSDKAPGQPFVAVPLLWLADRLGFGDAEWVRVREVESSEGTQSAVILFHLGDWWLGVWFASVPGAVLGALMVSRITKFTSSHSSQNHAEEDDGSASTGSGSPRVAVAAALALSLGTIILPLSADLFQHVLVAALVYMAWHVSDRNGRGRALAAGLLVAVAISVDYAAAIAAVIFAFFVIWRRDWEQLVFLVAAALPVGLLIGWYHQIVYGSPFRTSYAVKTGHLEGHLEMPSLLHLVRVFFGERGFVFTPIVLLALFGIIRMWRAGGRSKREAAVALAMFAGYLLLQISWPNPWGGDSPGPRYMTPALPFLAVPLAYVWERRTCLKAAALGTFSMGLAVVTHHLVGPGDPLIAAHIGNAKRWGFNLVIFRAVLPDAVAYAVYALLIAFVALVLLRTVESHSACGVSESPAGRT
ncbi:MAG: hypothetical protein KatS3mg008_1364 [Acidimicrobiales bacterium]|nr:MAG: hypothetical protein KatS3mg008_1364 [Acidimicrobiales bacterium]